MRRILIAGIAVVLGLSSGTDTLAQAPTRRVIEITAERFEFFPSEITVAQGEDVELHVRSDDTTHGFRLVGAGTNVTVPKRGKGAVIVRFTADAAGRYTFECSRMCGAGHNFMRGVLIVGPSSTGNLP